MAEGRGVEPPDCLLSAGFQDRVPQPGAYLPAVQRTPPASWLRGQRGGSRGLLVYSVIHGVSEPDRKAVPRSWYLGIGTHRCGSGSSIR